MAYFKIVCRISPVHITATTNCITYSLHSGQKWEEFQLNQSALFHDISFDDKEFLQTCRFSGGQCFYDCSRNISALLNINFSRK